MIDVIASATWAPSALSPASGAPAGLAAIGLVGASLYLGAYAAVQAGRLDGNGVAFTVMNTAAAALVLVGLAGSFNVASAVIQVAWLSIGAGRLLRQAVRALRTGPSPIHAAHTGDRPLT